MIPTRTMKGSCEISTAALTLTSQPPAFQGEAGALQVQVNFTLDGSAFSPDASTEAQVYLYYPASDVMTQAQTMAISGNTATATLSAEDQATPGAPYLVVQLTDTSSGALIVSCMAPLIIRQTRADTLTNGTAPNPSEVVYVGRAPYLSATNTWVVWDNTSLSFVDSGISAIGPEGPQGQTGPQGPQGETGATGATPDLTIGTVTTGAPGTDASATITGTPEDPVLNLQIPRGNPGAVQTVNGNEPDEQGNAQVDGLIYPTTAQALEAMSQEQQAELYAQGYRAIAADYDGTVTMHSLEADGSLAWVGCNQDTTNLLDNPDFSIAQAGHGGMHGTIQYAADRWIGDQAAYSGKAGGGIVVTSGDSDVYVHQRFAVYPAGRAMTLAMSINGVVACSSDVLPESGTSLFFQNGNASAYVSKEQNEVVITVFSGNTLTIDYCILLDGQYTAKTLPPWVAPDPVAELIKCRNFFRPLSAYGIIGVAVVDSASTVLGAVFGEKMRIVNPSLTGDLTFYTASTGINLTSVTQFQFTGNGFRLAATSSGGLPVGTFGLLIPSQNSAAISADL